MDKDNQRLSQGPRQRIIEEQLQKEVDDVADFVKSTENISSKNLMDMLIDRNYRVLHIDRPDTREADSVAKQLRSSSCVVETCDSQTAQEWFAKSHIWDAAVINLSQDLPAKGARLTKRLREMDSDIPIVLYVDDEQWDAFSQGEERGSGVLDYYKSLKREFGAGVEFVRKHAYQNYRYDVVDEQEGLGISVDKRSGVVQGVSISDLAIPEDMHGLGGRSSIDGISQALYDQFFQVRMDKKRLLAMKNGGSSFDLFVEEDASASYRLRESLFSFEKQRRGEFGYLHFVGASKLGDYIKSWAENPHISFTPGERLPEQIGAAILNVQARNLQLLFGEEKTRLLDPDSPAQYGVIDDAFFEEKPFLIVPYAPREVRRSCKLPLAYSDSNTNAAAAYFGVRDKILYIKRVGGDHVRGVGGVYTSDPQKPSFDPAVDRKLLEVRAQELLDGSASVDGTQYAVSCVGADGRDDHLVERHALELMAEQGIPRRIVVMDPRTPDLYRRFVEDDLVRPGDVDASVSSILSE